MRSASKPVGGLLFDLGVAVARRDDLDGEVRWTFEELARPDNPFAADECDIGSENGIGIALDAKSNVACNHFPEAMFFHMRAQT